MSDVPGWHVFKLCFVKAGVAWFTTRAPMLQTGDDWNDAPYEHNAGPPYAWQQTKYDHSVRREVPNWEPRYWLTTLRIDTEGWYAPDSAGWRGGNSPYSVEIINRCKVPWLTNISPYAHDPVPEKRVEFFAGCPLIDFVGHFVKAGGTIHVPYKIGDPLPCTAF